MSADEQTPGRPPGLSEPRQEPLGNLGFLSGEAGNGRGTLESQDDYDEFISYLRRKIAHRLESELDPEVQAQIAILMRLLATMRRSTLAQNRAHFETAFDLLAADKPNLTLIHGLCMDLAIAQERDLRGLTGLILRLTGNNPVTAVLAALGSIPVVLVLIMTVLSVGHAALAYIDRDLAELHPLIQAFGQLDVGDIMILVVSSFLGSVVSVLARLSNFLSGATFRPLVIYISVLTKPFLSVVFALFVYAVMKSGLISFPGVDLAGPSAPYVVWVIGFLSGFSERFSQDLILDAETKFGAGGTLGEKRQGSPPDGRR